MSFHRNKATELGLTAATKALLLDMHTGNSRDFNDAVYGETTPKKERTLCTHNETRTSPQEDRLQRGAMERQKREQETAAAASPPQTVLKFQRSKGSPAGCNSWPRDLTIQTVTPLRLLNALSAQNPPSQSPRP